MTAMLKVKLLILNPSDNDTVTTLVFDTSVKLMGQSLRVLPVSDK